MTTSHEAVNDLDAPGEFLTYAHQAVDYAEKRVDGRLAHVGEDAGEAGTWVVILTTTTTANLLELAGVVARRIPALDVESVDVTEGYATFEWSEGDR